MHDIMHVGRDNAERKKHAFVYECERVCSKVCVGNQGNLLMFVL